MSLCLRTPTGVATVVGVTSWGFGCGFPGLPGVYARVDHYLEWIDHTMRSLYYNHHPRPAIQPDQRECGLNNVSPRPQKIIGGSTSPYGTLPYQVQWHLTSMIPIWTPFSRKSDNPRKSVPWGGSNDFPKCMKLPLITLYLKRQNKLSVLKVE